MLNEKKYFEYADRMWFSEAARDAFVKEGNNPAWIFFAILGFLMMFSGLFVGVFICAALAFTTMFAGEYRRNAIEEYYNNIIRQRGLPIYTLKEIAKFARKGYDCSFDEPHAQMKKEAYENEQKKHFNNSNQNKALKNSDSVNSDGLKGNCKGRLTRERQKPTRLYRSIVNQYFSTKTTVFSPSIEWQSFLAELYDPKSVYFHGLEDRAEEVRSLLERKPLELSALKYEFTCLMPNVHGV